MGAAVQSARESLSDATNDNDRLLGGRSAPLSMDQLIAVMRVRSFAAEIEMLLPHL